MAQQEHTAPDHSASGHAAPQTPDTHASTQAHGGEHKGGLPQLNPNDWAPQLVWLAITFGALYWIMSRIALPRIADALEKRRAHIANDIDAAKRYSQESEQAEAAYMTSLAEAKAKAHTIAQEQRDTLNARTDKKRDEVEQAIAAKLKDAEQRISASKQAAMGEVNAIATDTTREIVERLVGGDLSREDLDKAVRTVAAS